MSNLEFRTNFEKSLQQMRFEVEFRNSMFDYVMLAMCDVDWSESKTNILHLIQ